MSIEDMDDDIEVEKPAWKPCLLVNHQWHKLHTPLDELPMDILSMMEAPEEF